MRLRVVHETVYRYERPVRGLVQVLRLTPRGHEGQHVRRWRIEPSVDGPLRAREDAFGNVVHHFSADGTAEEVTIRVSGEVETHETNGVVRGAVERVEDEFYLREAPLAIADAAIRDFADAVAARAGPDALARLHGLLAAVHEAMRFEPGPTRSSTPAAEAFALGRGVCQDLTHVYLAGARHLGIPARYVSGYFRRDDGVVEQEAGHAWAEARVPGLGWVGFDPANGICSGEAHLRVAVGLDYLGAAPIRGSRYGGGEEAMMVRLRVDEPGPVQRQRYAGGWQVQGAGGQSQGQG